SSGPYVQRSGDRFPPLTPSATDNCAMWPDDTALRSFLSRARRRRIIGLAAYSAAGILLLATAAAFAVRSGASLPAPLGAVMVTLAIGFGLLGAAFVDRRNPLSALIERRAPQSRNVILTAAELLDHGSQVAPYVRTAVIADARRTIAS